jgi:excisionase family DNA binding protein
MKSKESKSLSKYVIRQNLLNKERMESLYENVLTKLVSSSDNTKFFKQFEMLTVSEFAQLLKVDQVTVRNKITKDIPYYRFGGSYRFLKSDIVDYIKNSKNLVKS